MSSLVDDMVKQVLEYSQGLPDGVPDARLEAMALRAVNNARKWAERQHDFQLSLVTVKGVIPGNGKGLVWTGSLEDFYEELVGDAVVRYKLKSVQTCYLVSADGGQQPLHHMRKNSVARENLDLPQYGSGLGLENSTNGFTPVVYFHGPRAFLNPPSSDDRTIAIDGYRWMDDYDMGDVGDFFLEHGADFILWQGVIELNHITKQFVQRQEGNLPPPTTARDNAWNSLLLWDDFCIDGGRQPDLN